jgi:hypothetical protein
MEASVKENIHFMWLAGMSQPDHTTINRFRSDHLRNVLKEIFSQVVLLLVENGLINLKQVYLDGTRIEAFVKYNYFHLEQKAKYADDPFRPENFYYNEQHDCFYCPMGQKMAKVDVEAVIG